ncbi:MAG: SRPBCC family protein [Myxococcota bacterium]|nr:SRPBCC family protein [Myxococcota bacterium]
MTRTLVAALSGILVVLSLGAPAWASEGKESREDRLAKGEVLITPRSVKGSDLPALTVVGVVDASPQKVWKIVSGCRDMHKHMSSVVRSRLVMEKGNVHQCETEIHVPGPYSNLVSITEAVHHPGPPVWKREWHLVKGDYKRIDASWTLKTFRGDPNRTQATYRVHAEPEIMLPDFLMKFAHKRGMKKLFRDVRRAVGAPLYED